MMILALLSAGKIAIAVLSVSLIILIVFIAYRKLLAHFGRNEPNRAEYCVLYSLEDNPSAGELQFYFTAEQVKKVAIQILNDKHELVAVVNEADCSIGGNIIRFDSTSLPNGNYYYALVSDNQKTVKKMAIVN